MGPWYQEIFSQGREAEAVIREERAHSCFDTKWEVASSGWVLYTCTGRWSGGRANRRHVLLLSRESQQHPKHCPCWLLLNNGTDLFITPTVTGEEPEGLGWEHRRDEGMRRRALGEDVYVHQSQQRGLKAGHAEQAFVTDGLTTARASHHLMTYDGVVLLQGSFLEQKTHSEAVTSWCRKYCRCRGNHHLHFTFSCLKHSPAVFVHHCLYNSPFYFLPFVLSMGKIQHFIWPFLQWISMQQTAKMHSKTIIWRAAAFLCK